jgi:dihydropyrimidinase
MSIIIRNGRIITAEQDFCEDIFVENEKVTAIGRDLICPADLVIDAAAKYVIPGGVDVHTHLDMPYCGTVSSDDFETGTRAAAFGGTTCLIDFAIQSRGMSLRQALDIWLRKGEKATVDYGLHMIVTDLPETHLAEIDEMVHAGVTSFKLFMAYPDTLMVDDATILRVMRRAAAAGGMVCIHAENGAMIESLVREAIAAGKTAPIYHALTRPVAAEAEAVNRTIRLAQSVSAPVYIVHLSTADALIMVAGARARGFPVFAETCPQYLMLSTEDLDKPGLEGAKYVFSPPAREKSHQDALWQGLRENNLQVVSTDHCPVLLEEKLAGARQNFTLIPNGGPGIEHRLQLLFHYGVNQRRIALNRWVEITSTAPAKMFGLYPRKGTIAVGSDADIVIWDPNLEHTISARTHHMRVDYSMFEGFQVRGNAETVIARGQVVVEKGNWLGAVGQGQFIRRGSFGLQRSLRYRQWEKT